MTKETKERILTGRYFDKKATQRGPLIVPLCTCRGCGITFTCEAEEVHEEDCEYKDAVKVRREHEA